MRLEIIAFQDYRDYTVILVNEGVVLLQGESGTGKSTVLRAIRWCLYGGSAHGERYEVVIHYKNLRIERKSKPMQLEVTDKLSEEVSHGDIAIQIIASVFGPVEIFDLCCNYQRHASRSPLPLFDPANKQRLSYLSSFAFDGINSSETPVELIEKIAAVRKKRQALLDKRRLAYKEAKYHLKELENRYGVPEVAFTWLNKESRLWFKERRRQIANQLVELDRQHLKNESRKALVKQLEEQSEELTKKISSSTKRLAALPWSSGSEPGKNKSIKERSEELREELYQLDMHEYWLIKTKVELFTSLSHNNRTPLPNFTERDCYEAERQEKERQENMKLCKELGIDYDRESVSWRISQLRTYLDYEQRKSEYNTYSEVKGQIDKLGISPLPLDEEKLKLQMMKQSRQALQCPHCEQLVYLKKGLLVKGGKGLSTVCTKEQIKRQEELILRLETKKKKLDSLIAQLELSKRKDVHRFEFDPTFEKMSLSISLDEVELLLEKLNKLRVVKAPLFTANQMRLIMRYRELKSSLERHARLVDEDDVSPVYSPEEIDTRRRRLEAELASSLASSTTLDKAELERAKCESVIASLKEQLENITRSLEERRGQVSAVNYQSKKIALQAKMKALDDKVLHVAHAREVKQARLDLLKRKTRLDAVKADCQALNSLYDNALDEHRMRLQAVVDQINGCAAAVIPLVFEYPISFAIELTEPKEGKPYKYSVSFRIIKRGVDCLSRNPYEELSGGEVHRLILAIIIALNQLYKSPLLLLDELFSSIDRRQRQDALEAIRRHLNGRLVICAEHFSEAGDYDQCIEVRSTWREVSD